MNRKLRTLSLGLLLMATPALAQTAPGAQPVPATPAPVTTPPGFGLPQAAPVQSAPIRTTPAQTAPSTRQDQTDPATPPADPAAPTMPATDPAAAPATETTDPAAAPAPTTSGLAAAAGLKLPPLNGEKALRTVPTVLGEAIIYSGSVRDALSRTVEALKAEGYTVAQDSGSSADRVMLDKGGVSAELTAKEQFGLTVLALSADLTGQVAANTTRDAPALPATDAAPVITPVDAAPVTDPAAPVTLPTDTTTPPEANPVSPVVPPAAPEAPPTDPATPPPTSP